MHLIGTPIILYRTSVLYARESTVDSWLLGRPYLTSVDIRHRYMDPLHAISLRQKARIPIQGVRLRLLLHPTGNFDDTRFRH